MFRIVSDFRPVSHVVVGDVSTVGVRIIIAEVRP